MIILIVVIQIQIGRGQHGFEGGNVFENFRRSAVVGQDGKIAGGAAMLGWLRGGSAKQRVSFLKQRIALETEEGLAVRVGVVMVIIIIIMVRSISLESLRDFVKGGNVVHRRRQGLAVVESSELGGRFDRLDTGLQGGGSSRSRSFHHHQTVLGYSMILPHGGGDGRITQGFHLCGGCRRERQQRCRIILGLQWHVHPGRTKGSLGTAPRQGTTAVGHGMTPPIIGCRGNGNDAARRIGRTRATVQILTPFALGLGGRTVLRMQGIAKGLSNLFAGHAVADFDPTTAVIMMIATFGGGTQKSTGRRRFANLIDNVRHEEGLFQFGLGLGIRVQIRGHQTAEPLIARVFQGAFAAGAND